MIVASGPMVFKALEARQMLSDNGIEAGVVASHSANFPDVDTIGAELAKSGSNLVTVEDHQLTAGAGAQLTHALKMSGVEFNLRSLGVEGEFGQSAYKADELYNKNGLGAESIAAACGQLIQARK